MQRVLRHYHIFKNSGSSFDRLLQRNFGKQHLEVDGPFPYFKINQDELLKILRNARPRSLSSHQINLPVPSSLDILVEPVVFIRHPVLRIRSIYQFGRKAKKTTPTGELAARLGLGDWIQACREHRQHRRVLSNAQTSMLSGTYGRAGLYRASPEGGFEFDLNQALRNLDAVQLLGRTEHFEEDVQRIGQQLRAMDIDFAYRRLRPPNRTSSDHAQPVEERLGNIERELGAEAYGLLLELNRQDLRLFDYASDRLGQ